MTQERVLKYCFFGSFIFFGFFQVLEFGVTQERVLKYYVFFVFCRFFCFLRACPRTSRILFSLFLCWFSAGFLKIVISMEISAFLWKSLLSLHFSIEISTSPVLFY